MLVAVVAVAVAAAVAAAVIVLVAALVIIVIVTVRVIAIDSQLIIRIADSSSHFVTSERKLAISSYPQRR